MTPVRLAARAAGRGIAWTGRTAARRAIARLAGRPVPGADPADVLRPEGGEPERRRYFAAVERGAGPADRP